MEPPALILVVSEGLLRALAPKASRNACRRSNVISWSSSLLLSHGSISTCCKRVRRDNQETWGAETHFDLILAHQTETRALVSKVAKALPCGPANQRCFFFTHILAHMLHLLIHNVQLALNVSGNYFNTHHITALRMNALSPPCSFLIAIRY